jgi:hypothetical protein
MREGSRSRSERNLMTMPSKLRVSPDATPGRDGRELVEALGESLKDERREEARDVAGVG